MLKLFKILKHSIKSLPHYIWLTLTIVCLLLLRWVTSLTPWTRWSRTGSERPPTCNFFVGLSGMGLFVNRPFWYGLVTRTNPLPSFFFATRTYPLPSVHYTNMCHICYGNKVKVNVSAIFYLSYISILSV